MGKNGITGRPQKEGPFTRWFCDRLKKVNAVTVAMVGGEFQRSGLPDRYVCHAKFRGWLEFKRGDRGTTEQQRRFMVDVNSRGDVAMVVRLDHADWVRVERPPKHASIKRGEVLAQGDVKLLKALGDPEAGLKILELLCKAREYLRAG